MVRRDDWMSEFYGCNWFQVTGSEPKIIPGEVYEWRIEPHNSLLLTAAQKLRFSLVETLVEFVTTVSGSHVDFADIRLATKSDLPAIVQITHQMYTEDAGFQNRFMNKVFFTKEMASRYFELSVVNCFKSQGAVSCVADIDGEIQAYFMMSKIGDQTYKGMMTAVKPSARGKQLHTRMQDFCYGQVGKPFQIVNTTQLSNLVVINNHIKKARKLAKVEHIFLLKS